jgi:hypothetical protein
LRSLITAQGWLTGARRHAQAVKVARKLGQGFARPGLVPQHNAANGQFRQHGSGSSTVLFIMVAGYPHPIDQARQGRQPIGRSGIEPRRAMGIVEIVAQAKDPPRARVAHQRGEPVERFAAVIGRQHLPAAGEPACLFQVQIGHQQRLFGRPDQRPRRAEQPFLAGERERGERKGNHAFPLPQARRFGKPWHGR